MRSRLISRTVFAPSPAEGVAVMGFSFYTRPVGLDLIGIHWQMTRSDTIDVAYRRRSHDNGRTWSQAEEIVTGEKVANGVLRSFPFAGHADPLSGRLLTMRMEGLLPADDPVRDGPRQWHLHYTVSEDGGQNEVVRSQVIQSGPQFDAAHPLPGLWVGKNALQLGAITCVPLTLPDGTILVPCQLTPLGDDGEYSNPGGGLTYYESLVLRGRWRLDKRLDWQSSATVKGDPERSTRGMIEPTVGLLNDGRVLMVMRGSNDVKPQVPGTKWFSISSDGGATWTPTAPWAYSDGEVFYSPSSCSQLLHHSSGALLWLGNIAPENPRGNHPRFPLVIGEVDRSNGLLIRDSLSVIDDRGPDDSELLMLSNFNAHEDRETGEVVLHMTRLFAAGRHWTADALQYRLAVEFD
ncbi:MAG TPA: sialidase family protein [Abditibacteriaceae bacterium]|nr:sialidase family protein [Abditibacteriaceae bacterium]